MIQVRFYDSDGSGAEEMVNIDQGRNPSVRDFLVAEKAGFDPSRYSVILNGATLSNLTGYFDPGRVNTLTVQKRKLEGAAL